MRLILLIILTPFLLHSQEEKIDLSFCFNRYKAGAPLVFIAGTFDGLNEVLKHHPQKFFERHPNASPQWFDPAISHRNKYKNGNPAEGAKFFGSTTIFVAATDQYHLNRTIAWTTGITGALTVGNIKEYSSPGGWKLLVLDFLVLSSVETAGFHLSYSIIYK